MPEEIFRAVRPANESMRPDAPHADWGIYDVRVGKVRGKHIYTEAFARVLADSMNWSYNQGRGDR